ncbi:NAD(P)-dependent oxidoreductase [Amycolatopsis albispora]|uniref:6-phosphogluconate dehydrogenase n=1 Tax=Amycolatopsis albispora TaxID=1804986 RepID=A0A344L505_9PSEU|nr:NAD(P)-binding domain-containing protein [Amycolatopsis albispora]AXB43129.1 6-phosphogluconate dehydrogenase [Amycolatopsis albispora]
MTNNPTPVTFIGLGPMGQAMVRVLLTGGHPVTVWNRTASRADGVVAAGAKRADSAADAVAENELVILSLTDYQAMYDILGPLGDVLKGRVVVNLSSDTPSRTREAAEWLAERGAELIAGGVMVPAEMVGQEGSYVFYSGPEAVFERFRDTLALIGRTDHLGADHALAQLFYQAQLDIFLTSLSAYLHANALLEAHGVPAERFWPYAESNFNTIAPIIGEAPGHIDSGEHPGDEANAKMMGATADHIVQASYEAGIDTGLPRAVKDQYDRAIAAGDGAKSWTSLFEQLRRRR